MEHRRIHLMHTLRGKIRTHSTDWKVRIIHMRLQEFRGDSLIMAMRWLRLHCKTMIIHNTSSILWRLQSATSWLRRELELSLKRRSPKSRQSLALAVRRIPIRAITRLLRKASPMEIVMTMSAETGRKSIMGVWVALVTTTIHNMFWLTIQGCRRVSIGMSAIWLTMRHLICPPSQMEGWV